jgi:hypothetical protein
MASPRVDVVSGGMGESGDQPARTALAQYPDIDAPIEESASEVVSLVKGRTGPGERAGSGPRRE